MRRTALVLGLVTSVLLPTAAAAGWSARAQGAAQVPAATMTNATAFRAACTTTRGNSTVTLTWTVSPDSFVEGYEIVRTGTGGAPSATFQLPRAQASYEDAVPTKTGYAYSYTIRAGSTTIAWRTPRLAAVGTPTYSSNTCTA